MSDVNPLDQLAQYQAYLANQQGQDDPFQVSPDALTQLVIQSIGQPKGLTTLGSQLSRLSTINSLIGKPTKENLAQPFVDPPSVVRSMYGDDPVYTKVFDDLDAGKPLHQLVTEIDQNVPNIAGYADSVDTIKQAAADYAKEKAQSVANKTTYNAQHPNQAPVAPSKADIVEGFLKKYAPTQTKAAQAPRVQEQQNLDAEVKKTGVSFTPDEIKARLAAVGPKGSGNPMSAASADARIANVIKQVVARKLAGG